MGIMYLTPERALKTYEKTIEVSGGGSCGFIGNGRERFESILTFIQDDGFYPSFEEKITHLFFALCKDHLFQDGNKRIAITLTAQMLIDNGYICCISSFIRRMENYCWHVAAGSIKKDLLQDIIVCVINGKEEDESLLLRIIDATNDAPESQFRLSRSQIE
ncbi:MAG: Fic family protein [Synergistaceae bacterium]|nr:Fic family protein [Synergistaceae bacterium]